MKRLAAALALLALSGALVFPSAAAPFALTQSDRIAQDVALVPGSGPNGDYAYLDEDDELVVDLTASNPNLAGDVEGVNPDGVTTLADVFRVRYNGSRYAHVWITDESDAVTFTVDGQPIDSESSNVTLGPNESVAVGVVVDTTGGTADGLLDAIEVNARVADPETAIDTGSRRSSDSTGGAADGMSIQQSAPSGTERSVEIRDADESATVDLGSMSMDGSENVTLDELDLTAGGDTVALDLAAVAPNASGSGTSTIGVEPLAAVEVTEADAGSVDAATLRFSVSPDYLAERGVAPAELAVFRTSDGETSALPVRVVGARDDGRVVFEADTPGFSTFTVAASRPSVGVAEASLSASSIDRNDTATVTARVVNEGRANGTRTVTLTLDGAPVAERTVALGPNETTTVTFEVAPGAAGTYDVAVDGTAAGTLVVSDADGSADAASDAGTAASTEAAVGTPAGTAAPTGSSGDEAIGSEDGEDQPLATAEPVEEPAAVGLPAVGGLALAAALLVAALALVRRVSR
ncbi:PGF-pre-PGF domain-containing protein [Halobaculum lipolyticum]|uniref:PGF-pre-PGF domain-containing protein n=1 Tax=Halobaculum lipolyticum TaxID=3032001 RepID=A0ABD5WA93_9EURY|nr:PGF-pre-PGF domain-containing protein [Halobaculum sp. DT31]